jgi:hypothetical protein
MKLHLTAQDLMDEFPGERPFIEYVFHGACAMCGCIYHTSVAQPLPRHRPVVAKPVDPTEERMKLMKVDSSVKVRVVAGGGFFVSYQWCSEDGEEYAPKDKAFSTREEAYQDISDFYLDKGAWA